MDYKKRIGANFMDHIVNERLKQLKKYIEQKADQDAQRQNGKLEEIKEDDIISDSVQFDQACEKKFFKLIAVLIKGHDNNLKML